MLCRTDGGNDVYIGSTSCPLGKRLADHRHKAGNPSRYYGGSKLYQKMLEVGVHRWKIIPLLTFACNRDTIFEFEREWVKATGASLNTFSPVNGDIVQKECDRRRRRRNKETKWFYCEICDIKCKDKYDLRRHLGTLKHSYAWLNSLD